jgi:HSP20 family protein
MRFFPRRRRAGSEWRREVKTQLPNLKKGGVFMAIKRWRPFRDLVSVRDEMNKLFDDFFGRLPMRMEEMERMWAPNVDVSETKDDIIVIAEIPGMTKDDIKVTLHENILTLSGEKQQEKEEKETNYHRVERSYGSFSRSFDLPTKVQFDKIKANYQDGILKITLPKSEEVKPKEIPIAVN